MSYLERQDPGLFAKYLANRALDPRLADIVADIETMAQVSNAQTGTEQALFPNVVADLIDELRRRIAACETGQRDKKE